MKYFSATDAKNKFGELIDQSGAEPIAIRKNGRDIRVILSAETYETMRAANDTSSLVMQLHEESISEFGDLYTELAK